MPRTSPPPTFSLRVRNIEPATGSCSISPNEPDHVLDQLSTLRRLETTTYRRGDYMSANASLMNYLERQQKNHVVNNHCRQTLCTLLYQVADHCEFRRDVVSYAMLNILDRFLATSTIWARSALTNRLVYQLAAMTALQLAVKMLESVTLDIDCLVDIGKDCYQRKDFEAMERQMLIALNWRVGAGPTPLEFVELYLAFAPTLEIQETMLGPAQYQLELAVAHYDLIVDASASELALAAVWNAIEGMDEDLFSHKQQAVFQQKLLNALATSIDLDFKNHKMVQRVDELQTKMSVIMLQSLRAEDLKQQQQQEELVEEQDQNGGEDKQAINKSITASSSTTSPCDNIKSAITCNTAPPTYSNDSVDAPASVATSVAATAGNNSPISVVTDCTNANNKNNNNNNNNKLYENKATTSTTTNRRRQTPDTPPLLPSLRATRSCERAR